MWIGIVQVYVRETDQSWIYGLYTCRARNVLGIAESQILLKRASECFITFTFNLAQKSYLWDYDTSSAVLECTHVQIL